MATKKGKSVMDWENAADSSTPTVFYRTLNLEGLEIFYREAGPRDAPAVLLLHGFPSSSHMFRNLIPMLADKTASSRVAPGHISPQYRRPWKQS